MCSLSKEEFLARAPAFVGDILWAHLENLQKDVDHGANIENVPSNYSDSFAIPSDAFQRTYTELGAVQNLNTAVSVPNSVSNQTPTVDSTSNLVTRPYTTGQRSVTTSCYPTSVADYVSNNGSTVDSSSEFSYQMTEMKYSPQQQQNQQQQIQNNGRVPSYPPLVYNDQFGTENMWPYQPSAPPPLQAQPHDGGWHQPHDYPHSATPPVTLATPTSTQNQTPMHHHPAFLQVCNQKRKMILQIRKPRKIILCLSERKISFQ